MSDTKKSSMWGAEEQAKIERAWKEKEREAFMSGIWSNHNIPLYDDMKMYNTMSNPDFPSYIEPHEERKLISCPSCHFKQQVSFHTMPNHAEIKRLRDEVFYYRKKLLEVHNKLDKLELVGGDVDELINIVKKSKSDLLLITKRRIK